MSHGYKIAKVGDPLYLVLQLDGGETNKYPRAYLTKADGTAVTGSPVDLVHEADGKYKNSALVMPNTPEVKATYKVFDDSGHTSLSTDYPFTMDIIQLDNITAAVNSIIGPTDIEGQLEDDEDIDAEIEDC
jgi:hypothetical protein